ncbi:MAG: phytoene/squalene synthase family protein [Chitinophagaceae bacterium]|nr:phytoene/squalene synthase family protein [Chitinophagaceae bacterium]
MNIETFHAVSRQCSKTTTESYSTSFASAIKLLHPELRQPIYNIYGFVRFADEIVDTFHDHDKKTLLQKFRTDTFEAIENGISLNPILDSFQQTINRYAIDHELIYAFFRSMEMDLQATTYNEKSYNEYIFGSAEVVGLMCLYVFCDGNHTEYQKLAPAARSLGAAFQKVNFLRDVASDYNDLSRVYFPGVDFTNFSTDNKKEIEKDIASDFENGYKGILLLPWKARFGVYVAFKYYFSLFRRIKQVHASRIFRQRIRVPDFQKLLIVARAGVKNQLKMI